MYNAKSKGKYHIFRNSFFRIIFTFFIVILVIFSVAFIVSRIDFKTKVVVVPDTIEPLAVRSDTISLQFSPTHSDDGGMYIDSEFTLTSSEDFDEDHVQQSLFIEPKIQYTLKKESPKQFRITPLDPLTKNTVYSFRIQTVEDKDATLSAEKLFSWAFQTYDDVFFTHVFPPDHTVRIKQNSSIWVELNTDQWEPDGVKNFIVTQPNISGHIEKQGRRLIFVADSPLPPRQLITIQILAGFPLCGSEKVSESDFEWSFETGVDGFDETTYYQQGAVMWNQTSYEFHTQFAPVMGATWYKKSKVETLPHVSLWQLPEEVFISQMKGLYSIPSWSVFSRFSYHPSDILKTKVSEYDLRPGKTADGNGYIEFPEPITKGLYVVQVDYAGESQYALLQITDVSAYTSRMLEKNIIWAHNSRSANPLGGGQVTFYGTPDAPIVLDSEGFGLWNYPSREEGVYILQVSSNDGHKLFIPEMSDHDSSSEDVRAQYWYYFTSDRTNYASNDVVNVFGYVKPKLAKATSESAVRIRLVSSENPENTIDEKHITVSNLGSFRDTLRLQNFSGDTGVLEWYVGDTLVQSETIAVHDSSLPAYTLSLEQNAYAVVSGGEVSFTVTAFFHDGLPVVGLPLSDDSGSSIGTTDEHGRITFTRQFFSENTYNAYARTALRIYPTAAPDGNIFAQAFVDVYESGLILDVHESHIKGDTGTVNITANELNLDSYILYDDIDPSITPHKNYYGDSVSNLSLRADIVYWQEKAYQQGTYYDFAKKEYKPFYQYTQERVELDPRKVIIGSDGKAQLNFPATSGLMYEIRLRAVDSEGLYQDTTFPLFENETLPFTDSSGLDLHISGTASSTISPGVKLQAQLLSHGEPLEKRRNADFLFFREGKSREKYNFQNTSTYAFLYESDDVANLQVGAVWFDGVMYHVVFPTMPSYHSDERSLDVSMKLNQNTFVPGENTVAQLETHHPDGRPLPSQILIYITNDAFVQDDAALRTLSKLYISPSYTQNYFGTHKYPTLIHDNSDISSLKNSVQEEDSNYHSEVPYFTVISTEQNGKAELTLPIPSSEGIWHVYALAFADDLTALKVEDVNKNSPTFDYFSAPLVGFSGNKFSTAYPLFVEFAMQDHYAVGDMPIVRVSTRGALLHNDDTVEYTLAIPDLDFSASVKGFVDEVQYIHIPELSKGQYHATLLVKSGDYQKEVTKDFDVSSDTAPHYSLDTLEIKANEFFPLPMTAKKTLLFMDEEYSPIFSAVYAISLKESPVVDQLIAQGKAQGMLSDFFHFPSTAALNIFYDVYQQDDGGITMLPNQESDARLSARIAASSCSSFDRPLLKDYLWSYVDSPDASSIDKAYAYYGLAALNEPVLIPLEHIASSTTASYEERILSTLGLEKLGAHETAFMYYNSLRDTFVLSDGSVVDMSVFDDNNERLYSIFMALLAAHFSQEDDWQMFLHHAWEIDKTPLTSSLEEMELYQLVLPSVSGNALNFHIMADNDIQPVTLDHSAFAYDVSDVSEVSVVDPTEQLRAYVVYPDISYTSYTSQPMKDFSLSKNYSLYGSGADLSPFSIGMVHFDIKNPFGNDVCVDVHDVLPSAFGTLGSYPNLYDIDVEPNISIYSISQNNVLFCTNSSEVQYPIRILSAGDFSSPTSWAFNPEHTYSAYTHQNPTLSITTP